MSEGPGGPPSDPFAPPPAGPPGGAAGGPAWGAPAPGPSRPGWDAGVTLPPTGPQWGQGAPGGWGAAPWAQPPQTEGLAIGALVAAAASFVVCPVVPAIVALVLAAQASTRIASSGGRLTGAGLVTAARVISWIHLALAVLGVIGLLVLVTSGVTTSSTP